MSTVLCHSHKSEKPPSAVLAIAILSSGNVRLEYCTYFSVIQICTSYAMIHYSNNQKWVSVTMINDQLCTVGTCFKQASFSTRFYRLHCFPILLSREEKDITNCHAGKHFSNPQNFILNSKGDCVISKYVRLNVYTMMHKTFDGIVQP